MQETFDIGKEHGPHPQGFAAELTDAFEVIPVVTGGEPIISGPVLTRLVLMIAHARNIDANRHMMANKPV